MVSSGRAPFRLRAPKVPRDAVTRGRLLDVLRGRFDRRLTVVRGGAGFGKTTLLAQAIAENALDPEGIDVWLQVAEVDRRPDQLVRGLLDAVDAAIGDAPAAGDAPADLDALIERLWSLAPTSVALVLDDLHHLDGSDGAAVVADLCARAPANVHLVLGTRTRPPVPFVMLQAQGEAAEVDEASLAFSPEDQASFTRVRPWTAGAEDVPTWPALAVLMATVGRAASLEYLWEAVLGSLDAEHRRALALLVRFGRVDDGIVAAVLGPGRTAAGLVGGLPLAEERAGEYRFHDLWRDALASEVPAEEWQAALGRGGRLLIERGEVVRGLQCVHLSGDVAGLVEFARAFAMAPLAAGLDATVAELLLDCLPTAVRSGALGTYLHLLVVGALHGDAGVDLLRDIHRRSGDDPELASLALWRLAQVHGDIDRSFSTTPEILQLVADVEELAAQGWPLARCARTLIASHRAEVRRDVATALAEVAGYEEALPELGRVAATSRYLALGHPERVAVTLDAVLAEGVSDPVHAQAVWLRGDIDPSVAWPIARELPAVYSRRQLDVIQVPLLGVLTSVALAAGDIAGARAMADEALVRARGLRPPPAIYADLADALVVLATDGDEAAARRFAEIVEKVPVEPWPAWAYIGAICPLRALVPGMGWLDDLQFGPAIATAVAAGRAVEALRRDGDPAGAIALPWRSGDLLRVHVPPSMLAELALAAIEVPAARECLDRIPDSSRWIRRLVDHDVAAVAAAARQLSAGVAERPGYRLEMTTFGEFDVRRTDGVPVTDRIRGGRVQQLVACLLVDQAPTRASIITRIWPDLGEKQGGGNLRVTLATLLDAIEPDRISGTSWFVSTRDARLQLQTEDIDLDVHRFEHHVAAAREAERNSRLTIALDHHRAALALHRGPFMVGVDDPDVEHLRLRLQTLAFNSGCRVAELLLARGEPEEALGVALEAARIDPIAERARRVEIRCHLALGSTNGARTTALRLHESLHGQGLLPDRETQLLLDRLLGQ